MYEKNLTSLQRDLDWQSHSTLAEGATLVLFKNESLKAEREIEMDRKDLGHLIHLFVSAGKFPMSNACEILCNKSLTLQHFNHFHKVTNYLSSCSQHCSLDSSMNPCHMRGVSFCTQKRPRISKG